MDRATRKRQKNIEMINEVDALNEEVKTLALNLAIYLAKAKANQTSDKINKLEPEFIRLVNGTVKVVQELTYTLNAARNNETMIYEPPAGDMKMDEIEFKLQNIVKQCASLMDILNQDRGNNLPE
ncbi:MAG: hypothetical protein ACOYVF_06675 [Candidatus Zixiibacteriota bacterium]